MDLLLRSPSAQNGGFKKLREEWTPVLARRWGLSRQLSALEFEAFMDALQGLSMAASFRDGETLTFDSTRAALFEFAKELQRTKLAQVEYARAALRTLGAIYKDACVAVKREGCERHDDYPGWLERRRHGIRFSRRYTPVRRLLGRFFIRGFRARVPALSRRGGQLKP